MQAATFVHTNAYEALQAAAVRFPGWPVMLTGHSMGGIHSATTAQTNWRRCLRDALIAFCPPLRKFDCPSTPPLQSCHLNHASFNPAGCCTGGVAAVLAALLRDGGAPEGLGPAVCIAFGCAAVFSRELAEAVTPFTTSVIYGSVLLCLQSAGQGPPMKSSSGCSVIWIRISEI